MNEVLDEAEPGVYDLFKSNHIQINVNTVTKEITMSEALFRKSEIQTRKVYVVPYSISDLDLFEAQEVQETQAPEVPEVLEAP